MIGILGGSFDPIHNGHLTIAKQAKEKYKLEKIIFVPVNNPWAEKLPLRTKSNHRVDMLNLAIKSEEQFEASLVDIKRGGTSYTIDTINDLQFLLSEGEKFHVIVGADNIKSFCKWQNYDELKARTHIVIASRNNLNARANVDAKYLNNVAINISSTEIREKIQAKQDISGLVPEEVKTYIINKQLYL